MNFTKEDIEKIEKFIEIKNKGYYCDGTQLTEVYNRVLDKRVNVTNCGSCLRGRVQELENALNHYKEQLKSKEQEKEVVQEENNQPVAKKVGRPPKKKE